MGHWNGGVTRVAHFARQGRAPIEPGVGVLAFPPSDERSSIVSVESRYGTCGARSPRARITLPNAERLELIATAWPRAAPSTPALRIRSEPARSTDE